jgi:hypothetical protein
MQIKEVKKNIMGSKRYLINKKNQNAHQECIEEQKEHIARNHWKALGTSKAHDKVLKNVKNTKSVQQGFNNNGQ